MLDKYRQYIDDVSAGREVVCSYVRLAVERQASDLARQGQKDFPYVFSESSAAAAVGFAKMLRHVSGQWAGQRFDPEPDQVFLLAVLFGWKHKDTGLRRFRRAYVEVARKNGKSFLASVVQLVGLLLDGEDGAQIFSAATTRDQARIVFDTCKDMASRLASDSPAIASRIKIFAHSIVDRTTGGTIKPLSSDAQKLDGHSPHIAVIDEYHEHKTNSVLKVMETGMGARSQPLSFVITTAGFNVEGPCYRLRKTAIQILEGQKADETFFAIIYTLDENDDWTDRKTWKKANPHIGISPSWEFMESEFTKAQNEGHESEVQFLTKNLNVWTTSSATWIQNEKWLDCQQDIDWAKLEGVRCWGGIDLGEVFDFTAFCLAFQPDPGSEAFRLKWWFWIPEDVARINDAKGQAPYLQWAREGHIKLTPGNMVDIDAVVDEIAEIGKIYKIEAVAIDPWGSKTNVLKFQNIGMPTVEVRQGPPSMSAPMKDFDRLVNQTSIPDETDKKAKQKLYHDGNPVMRWMLQNVEIQRDHRGNIAPSRKRKENKIDGVVAGIMALGLAIDGATKNQTYYWEQEPIIIF